MPVFVMTSRHDNNLPWQPSQPPNIPLTSPPHLHKLLALGAVPLVVRAQLLRLQKGLHALAQAHLQRRRRRRVQARGAQGRQTTVKLKWLLSTGGPALLQAGELGLWDTHAWRPGEGPQLLHCCQLVTACKHPHPFPLEPLSLLCPPLHHCALISRPSNRPTLGTLPSTPPKLLQRVPACNPSCPMRAHLFPVHPTNIYCP